MGGGLGLGLEWGKSAYERRGCEVRISSFKFVGVELPVGKVERDERRYASSVGSTPITQGGKLGEMGRGGREEEWWTRPEKKFAGLFLTPKISPA